MKRKVTKSKKKMWMKMGEKERNENEERYK